MDGYADGIRNIINFGFDCTGDILNPLKLFG